MQLQVIFSPEGVCKIGDQPRSQGLFTDLEAGREKAVKT